MAVLAKGGGAIEKSFVFFRTLFGRHVEMRSLFQLQYCLVLLRYFKSSICCKRCETKVNTAFFIHVSNRNQQNACISVSCAFYNKTGERVG